MENTDSIFIANKNNPKDSNFKDGNNDTDRQSLFSKAIPFGIAGGVLMGFYLLVLNATGVESIGLKFLKYLFLIVVIGIGLSKYRKEEISPIFFPRGLALGAFVTFISGVVLIAINLLIGVFMPAIAFDKFNLAIDSDFDILITSGAMFFEVLVFGMVSTFIWLQYLKGRQV